MILTRISHVFKIYSDLCRILFVRLDPTSVGAQVKLEAFLELNCPDSSYSWPILKELQENYGPENLEVVIHHVPLPYHRQAFICTQVLFY